jgi:hypothetical protein
VAVIRVVAVDVTRGVPGVAVIKPGVFDGLGVLDVALDVALGVALWLLSGPFVAVLTGVR